MINANDIIQTALAMDALQTHVSADAVGVDVRLRPAMERCVPAVLAAVQSVCGSADTTDDAVRSAMEMYGAYRLLAMVYGATDAVRADFYAQSAAEYASVVRDSADSRCPAYHTPSWT